MDLMIQTRKIALIRVPLGLERSRTQALAGEIQGRYERMAAGMPAVRMALRHARVVSHVQTAWHLHLAPRLELAILSGNRRDAAIERGASGPQVTQPAWAERRPQAAQAVLALRHLEAAGEPLAARLQARSLRTTAPGPQTIGQAAALPAPAATPVQAPAAARRELSLPAARVFLRRAEPPASAPSAAAPPAAGQRVSDLPAFHRAGGSLPAPVLSMEQFPPHEVNRLAERVAQTIDRRIQAQRERLGRV